MGSFARVRLLAMSLVMSVPVAAQGTPRTIVGVFAHADDETPAGAMFARYAREGVKIHWLIATDGGQGTGSAASRTDTVPRDQELVRARTEEARCAAQAIGAEPPILMNFPDGKLGDFISDRSLGFRLTARIAEELQRLEPDVIVTWGPEGGYGHPDHRMVSNIVTQLQRAGAPGVPERIFFMHLSAEAIAVANPQRGAAPLVVPHARYVTTHVSFTPQDMEAAGRAMACHKTQFTAESVQRIQAAMGRLLNGAMPFVPAFPTAGRTDLFR